MLVRLATLWLWLLVPGAVAVGIGGPTGLLPHAVFHPLYIATLAGVVVAAFRFRVATARRSLRVLAVLVAAMAAVAVIGQTGEEIVVFRHGGLDAPDSLMHEADHLSWAMAGLGGIFFAQFLAVALSIVGGVALLRHGDRRGWAPLAVAGLYVADFAGSLAGLLWSGMWLSALLGVGGLCVVALRTRRTPTVLDLTGPGLPRAAAPAILAP